MGKMFRSIVAIVFVVTGLCPVFVQADPVDDSETITIGVTIPGSFSLSIETRNVSDNANVVPMALNFTGIGGAALPPGNPWVVSDQYIRVQYASNYATWGVRIVTDNEDLEGDPNDVIDTLVGLPIGTGPDGLWGTADDILSYAGLVTLSSLNPAHRAGLAWQVFASTQPAITSPSCAINPDGSLGDVNVGAWDANWAYLADKNDMGFNNDILEDGDLDGEVDDPTYPMVVVGPPSSGGSLAQHPAAPGVPHPPRPGDGDIALYMAARFANTNWSGGVPTPILLPPYAYGASLYVEIMHD